MGVLEIGKGMGVTLSKLFQKPVTVSYPEQRATIQPRFRGRHVLTRHPAYAIYVEAAENTPEHMVSPGERYASVYEINMLRCIFCGMCEEACPTGAVVMGNEFEMADYRYRDFVYAKEDMLVGVNGSVPQRREAAKAGKPVRLGFTVEGGPRAELEGVKYE